MTTDAFPKEILLHGRFRFRDSAGVPPDLRNAKTILIFGAGAAGARAAVTLQSAGIEAAGFADNNPNLHEFAGTPVYRPEAATKKFPDAAYILAVTVAADAARQLLALGIEEGWSLGVAEAPVGPLGVGGACSGMPGEIAFLQATEYHKSLLCYPNECRSGLAVELPITEKCTLRCRECGNLMPYYAEPKHLPTAELTRDLDIAASAFDFIPEIRIIGGEPLLHPDAAGLALRAAGKKSVGYVGIVTNGTIIPSADALRQLAGEGDGKIYFRISNYGPLSRRLPKLLAALREAGLAAFVLENPAWTRGGVTEAAGLDLAGLTEKYNHCTSRFCLTLMRGRMYHCEFAANFEAVRGGEPEAGNSVDLLDEENRAGRLWKFVHYSAFAPTCDRCPGFARDGERCPPAEQTTERLGLGLG